LSDNHLDKKITDFADRLKARLPCHVESLLYYPHPFTSGGFVIVYKDNTGCLPDVLSEVYHCSPPPGMLLYHTRRSDLFELSFPSMFLHPNLRSDYPHLAFWARNKGRWLYGPDLRDEILVPANPKAILASHIEECRRLRRYRILERLMSESYLKLIEELGRDLTYLMASGLLIHNQWDITIETVPGLFHHYYQDGPLQRIWKEYRALQQLREPTDQVACRQAAFEAVWLFECFLEGLEEYTL
jgi:hypothetical protein